MTDLTPHGSDTTAAGATRQQPGDVPHRNRTMLEQWGGVPGMVYMTLPVMAFVVANSLLGLNGAIVTAFAVALAVMAVRIIRRESVAPAVNGLLGVALAAGISWWTGSAKDYFLLGIWLSLAGAVLFTASVIVRRPLAGLVWNGVTGKGDTWRKDRICRFYYDIATLALAAVFAARFVVQQWLYDSDETGWLGFAKIAMGYPLLGLALLVVAWAARRSAHRLHTLSQPRSTTAPAQPRPHTRRHPQPNSHR
ncbi:DUF3159 domain-containing protein [Streptomyces sp. NPDC088387]|uniref:DUF3159 domain-containing protein n=1 Tax=Streptomyces sp. NPDC088387 TaxID=3365859 RepID=UPI0038297824